MSFALTAMLLLSFWLFPLTRTTWYT